MKTFTTEHEARIAVEAVLKNNPGCVVDEIHVDSETDHNWYITVLTPTVPRKIIFKCKWSSPIIKFK